MEDAKIAGVLNDLVETSRDGATGFKTCAEGASDPMLKAFFQTRAQNCEEAVRALNIEVLHHGGKPIEHGSAAGALRRAWINIRTAVSSNDDLAVLEECEGAEDAALEAYRKALLEDLPAHVRTLLQQQQQGATENHNRVRQLRDERKLAKVA
ncbi:MAG: PA2169 family four-helix-bundle protein [Sulfuritalea sp.]|nr:PA2169 family four-helix-bundle protein [Sulfuritalea sp.]